MDGEEMKNIKTKHKKGFFYTITPLYAIIIFLTVWQITAARGTVPFLPSPLDVVKRMGTVWTSTVAKRPMIDHVLVSVKRILIALSISIVIGVPFGLAIGWNKTFRAIAKPIFDIVRPVPPIAWVPLITLWLGTTEISRILVIIIGVFVPIVINTYTGVVLIPQINIDVGRAFMAKSKDIFCDVVMPSSLNAIFVGIRTALGKGWMVLVAAEMVGAKYGIGYLINQGQTAGDIEMSIIGMVIIGIFGAGFAFAFDYLERLLCPWKQI